MYPLSNQAAENTVTNPEVDFKKANVPCLLRRSRRSWQLLKFLHPGVLLRGAALDGHEPQCVELHLAPPPQLVVAPQFLLLFLLLLERLPQEERDGGAVDAIRRHLPVTALLEEEFPRRSAARCGRSSAAQAPAGVLAAPPGEVRSVRLLLMLQHGTQSSHSSSRAGLICPLTIISSTKKRAHLSQNSLSQHGNGVVVVVVVIVVFVLVVVSAG